MNLLFLDTETTGKEETDRLCQVAFRWGAVERNSLFKPPVQIGLEAMSVHHITNKMVEDKPQFIGSEDYVLLSVAAPQVVLVAHNASFDLAMLTKEGLVFPDYIDTLKVVRHLDVDSKMEKHNLQYLRYFFAMDIEATAHDAWGDIMVLEQLFHILQGRLMTVEEIAMEADAVWRMQEISMNPVLIRKFSFGKHKGTSVEEVADKDRGYLHWLLREKSKEPVGEEDWLYTLQYYGIQ